MELGLELLAGLADDFGSECIGEGGHGRIVFQPVSTLCLFIAVPEVTGAYCFPPVQRVLTAVASRLQLARLPIFMRVMLTIRINASTYGSEMPRIPRTTCRGLTLVGGRI